MKFSSDLLSKLLLATGRQTGREALQAQDLQLLPVLMPVATVPGPLQRFGGFDNSVIERESFIARQSASQGPSSGQIVRTIVLVGRGLWRIVAQLDSMADYTLAPTSNNGSAFLVLADSSAAANAIVLAEHWAAANVPQHTTLNFDLLLPDDNWAFNVTNGVTGVGQTNINSATIIASRLS